MAYNGTFDDSRQYFWVGFEGWHRLRSKEALDLPLLVQCFSEYNKGTALLEEVFSRVPSSQFT